MNAANAFAAAGELTALIQACQPQLDLRGHTSGEGRADEGMGSRGKAKEGAGGEKTKGVQEMGMGEEREGKWGKEGKGSYRRFFFST